MTRFARAHGSKASNERQPEEATSWNTLKQQLVEQQSASKEEVKNASKQTRKPFVMKKGQTTEWAEFEETPEPKHKKTAKKREKSGRSETEVVERSSLEEQHSSKSKLHKVKSSSNIKNEKKLEKRLKKIKGHKVQKLHSNGLKDLEQVVTEVKPQVTVSKREKRKNKLQVLENSVESFNPGSPTDTNAKLKTTLVNGSEHQLSKRQKKRLKQIAKKKLDNGFDLKRPLKIDDTKKPKLLQVKPLENVNGEKGKPKLSKQQKVKGKLKKQLTTTSPDMPDKIKVETTDQTQSHSKLQVQSKRQKRNKKKLGDGTEVKERKLKQLQATTMVLNGQEIQVTMFDGFPIRKQDADRLKELRKQMVDNGIPPEEIQVNMKLERRRAEKALAREKRSVCFHCRKGGHNLSDCPTLMEGSNQHATVTGICFKCGSTEHTHFECRVVRGQEFRFAKCFICQEQGHISWQCPDNPRGLYPKGGGCKVCGDVTHLKKDCPDLHEKKEQNVITLDTARSDKLEALDEDLRIEDNRPAVTAPKKKIVKF